VTIANVVAVATRVSTPRDIATAAIAATQSSPM
jgi:hypothetical protein